MTFYHLDSLNKLVYSNSHSTSCDSDKRAGFKAVLYAITTIFFITPAYGDWTALDSGVTTDLSAVDFPANSNTGYVVGNRGTILKTSNAGNSWKKQNSRTRASLKDVDFIDDLTGYAVGLDGTILKTTNGGSSWTALNSGTSLNLYTVNFPVDANTGYVGGDSRTLLKTTDGGQTWTPQFGPDGYVRDIIFPQNSQSGYISTIYGTLGYIYKTTDGGQNWTRVLWLEDASPYSMSFPVDDQVGYVANHDTYSRHGIWKTSDGGANWDFVTAGITAVPVAVDFPVNAQTGFAGGYAGAILQTNDAGTSWTEGGIGINTTLRDVHFVDNSTGYAVGNNGVIVKSSNGGTPQEETVYLHPTASGSVNTFTHITSCSADWDCVNDQTGNLGTGLPETVNSRDYVADGSGNRAMFALDDGVLGSNSSVSKICVSLAATQYNGSRASISYQRVGIDPAPIDTAAFWVTYWYNGMASHCWSNLNWSASELDALEIGVKSVSGKWLEASQLYVKVFYTASP